MIKFNLTIVTKLKLVLFLVCFMFFNKVNAQNNQQLLGYWVLDKIALANTKFEAFGFDETELKAIFKTVLLQKLVKEEPIIYTELEDINKQVEELVNINNQSIIEIQKEAIYNRTKTELSGEYLLKNKELLVEWSNAEKSNLKIVKLNKDVLVLKDEVLNLVYYYNKPE